MKLAVWPFVSQFDREHMVHRLDTCGACKQLAFVAERVQAELGWDVVAAVPYTGGKSPFTCPTAVVAVPLDNPAQRVHWDTFAMQRVLADADVLLLNHEYMAIPARALFPKKRIIQMCSVRPDTALFRSAWDAADLVVAQGKYAAERIRQCTATPVSVWPLAYDEREFGAELPRSIDVLFVQRCSATNYTHHQEFIEAMRWLNDKRVVFTDVTKWLRLTAKQTFEYSDPENYLATLHSSKVAVALYDSWYGGLAVREAARAGCSLVLLDVPAYREMGNDPHFTDLNPSHMASVIKEALSCPRKVDVSQESYQVGWQRVKEDLEKIASKG